MESTMTRARLRFTFLFLFLFSLVAFDAAAQTAGIGGRVVDAARQPIARGYVRLIDAAGKTLATAITDGNGQFSFAQTNCRDCKVEASLAGFKTVTLTASPNVTLTLDVAPIEAKVVVTATRDATPLSQVGATTTVFSAEDIVRRGEPMLADLLRQTPGVAVIRNGGLGNVTSLFMRGGESSHTKVLLDGIPLNEPGGTFNFGNLTTFGLERVEVVRGAQSALFGSDAMSGVIQLVSARGQARNGNRPTVTGSVEAGGYNTFREQAAVSGANSGWDYSIGASRLDTDNRSANNKFKNTTLLFTGGGAITPTVMLRALGRLEQGKAGAPGQTAFGRPDLDAFFDRQELTGGVAVEHRPSARWKQRVSYALTRSDQESTNLIADADYVPTFGASKAPFAFSDFTYDSHNVLRRHFLSYQTDWRFSGRVTQFITAVADWDGERATLGDRIAKTSLEASRNNAGVSVQHQLVARRASIATSLRFEHNDSFGDEWVPRISGTLVARTASGTIGDTVIKGNAGLGVKEPTILQSFSTNNFFLGNADLLPERARTWDVGVEQRFANDRARVEGVYFDNRYEDLITTKTISFSPFKSQYTNKLGYTNARGIELAGEFVPVPTLRVGGGYTWLDSDVFDRATANSDPTLLASLTIRRPRHSAFVRAAWSYRDIAVDLDGTFVGTRLDNDFSSLSPAITSSGDDWVWNLNARYAIRAKVEIFGRVNNLADRDYMEPLGYPAWRRTGHVGLKVRF
jgi:vitamin B12 transporter